MNEVKPNASKRLRTWFENPQTPPDAWKTWRYDDIAKDAEVSPHTVKLRLQPLVQKRYPTIDSYARFKKAREAYQRINRNHGTRGISLSKKDIEDIRQRPRDGGLLVQIAVDTGHSYGTVQKYCKGIKLKRKRKM